MSKVIPFAFEQNPVRTVAIDGELWFVAQDVLKSLEYSEQSRPARVLEHIPAEWKGVNPIHTPGGKQDVSIISEQGLYFLLGRSDKPKALPFQKWIAGEVIPSIRKTGRYAPELPKPKPGLNPDARTPDIAGMLLNHDKLEEPDPRYPFPPVIEAQIRRKAEQLTRQAGDVIEEHIRRRVFGQSFQSWNKRHSEAMAVNAITHCTLENAMAYKYYAVLSDAIGWMGRFAKVATRLHGQAVTDQLYVSDQR